MAYNANNLPPPNEDYRHDFSKTSPDPIPPRGNYIQAKSLVPGDRVLIKHPMRQNGQPIEIERERVIKRVTLEGEVVVVEFTSLAGYHAGARYNAKLLLPVVELVNRDKP